MKNKTIFTFAAFSLFMLFSCSKAGEETTPPAMRSNPTAKVSLSQSNELNNFVTALKAYTNALMLASRDKEKTAQFAAQIKTVSPEGLRNLYVTSFAEGDNLFVRYKKAVDAAANMITALKKYPELSKEEKMAIMKAAWGTSDNSLARDCAGDYNSASGACYGNLMVGLYYCGDNGSCANAVMMGYSFCISDAGAAYSACMEQPIGS